MASYGYQLTMQSGPNPGSTYAIERQEVLIGRDLACDYLINDSEVSRRHARILQQGSATILEDLGSTNGTFVNGQRLSGSRVLHPGDTLQIGDNVILVYEIVQLDPDATVLSRSVKPEPLTPQSLEEAIEQDAAEEGEVEEPEQRRLLPLLLIIMAVVVVACGVGAVLWYIDANYLWCSVFPFLPGCP